MERHVRLMLDNENGLEGCVSVCRRISNELSKGCEKECTTMEKGWKQRKSFRKQRQWVG